MICPGIASSLESACSLAFSRRTVNDSGAMRKEDKGHHCKYQIPSMREG